MTTKGKKGRYSQRLTKSSDKTNINAALQFIMALGDSPGFQEMRNALSLTISYLPTSEPFLKDNTGMARVNFIQNLQSQQELLEYCHILHDYIVTRGGISKLNQ